MNNALNHSYTVSHDRGEGNRRAEAFFDEGTFVEIGAHLRRAGDSAEFEGVVTGYGAVDGRLVFGFFQDNSRMKGALDALYARKLEHLYSLAVKNGAPIVGVLDSAGAIIYDGAASMAAYGAWMKSISRASGVVPQITVIDGVCAGSAAVAAGMADFVIMADESAELYLNPEHAGMHATPATDRIVSLHTADEPSAFAAARTLLGLLPSNNAEGTVITDCEDDPNRVGEWVKGDVMASLKALADGGEFFELYGDCGTSLVAGFMRLSGAVCGVIAGDSAEDGGKLGVCEARKASKMLSFCDAFGIPFVSLVDCEGLREKSAPSTAEALARLAGVYASAECPLVTAVVGKAYGAGFTLTGSKALGADIVFALPDASIGLMSPASSVAFVWNDRIDGETTREDLEKEWQNAYASPAEAACRGEVDDVIEPAELRARLSAAVSMLLSKATGTPERRHPVMPL